MKNLFRKINRIIDLKICIKNDMGI
jgi:hypothetical protein